jgi:hypothetical protein
MWSQPVSTTKGGELKVVVRTCSTRVHINSDSSYAGKRILANREVVIHCTSAEWSLRAELEIDVVASGEENSATRLVSIKAKCVISRSNGVGGKRKMRQRRYS